MTELNQLMMDIWPAEEVDAWQLNRFIKRILQTLNDEQADKALDLVAGLTTERQQRVMKELSLLEPEIRIGKNDEPGELFLGLLERLLKEPYPELAIPYMKGICTLLAKNDLLP